MRVGTRVKGLYCGDIEFTGTIEEMRMLTVRTDGCFEFFVTLDQPVVYNGTERDTLVMYTKFDGSQSSYTRGTENYMTEIGA